MVANELDVGIASLPVPEREPAVDLAPTERARHDRPAGAAARRGIPSYRPRGTASFAKLTRSAYGREPAATDRVS